MTGKIIEKFDEGSLGDIVGADRKHSRHRLASPILTALIAISLCGLTSCGSKISGPSGDGWIIERVAEGNTVGLHSSVVSSSAGVVHLAYFDERNRYLYHGQRSSGGQWSYARLDTPGWVGQYVDICASAADEIHLAYQDRYVRLLRCGLFDGTTWTFEYPDITQTQCKGDYPKLLSTSQGMYLVDLYFEYGTINIWGRTLDSWVFLRSINVTDMVSEVDIAEGPDGLILGYSERLQKRLSYASGDVTQYIGHRIVVWEYDDVAGSWLSDQVMEVTNPEAKDAYYPSSVAVAFDAGGTRHVIYRNESGILIDDAYNEIDTNVNDSNIHLVRDSADNLVVLYHKGSNLSLAHWGFGGGWISLPPIKNIHPEGRWDLHCESDGTIHISVYNGSARELVYARREGPL